MKKKKKIWVSRGTEDHQHYYDFWHKKPTAWCSSGSLRIVWQSSTDRDHITDLCSLELHTVTGFELKPGELKCVTITIKEVKK